MMERLPEQMWGELNSCKLTVSIKPLTLSRLSWVLHVPDICVNVLSRSRPGAFV